MASTIAILFKKKGEKQPFWLVKPFDDEECSHCDVRRMRHIFCDTSLQLFENLLFSKLYDAFRGEIHQAQNG